MTARLLPEDEKKLSTAVSMLDSTSFSDDMPPESGESNVRLLCMKFSINFSDVKQDYRGVVKAMF